MHLRRSFIEDYLSDVWTMTELCATYQISRQTGYETIARFEQEGWAGLGKRSRRPHRTPTAVPSDLVRTICAARTAHPDWGARKVRRWLITQQPTGAWPSRMSVHRTWQRAGLVARPKPRRRSWPKRTTTLRPARRPNDVWTVDFKGDFRLGSGQRCYPLTLRDLASRYTLRCDALAAPDGPTSKQRFERAFQDFGLPRCLRSDNGEPFAGPGLAGLSQLNIWWLRLGIAVEQIAPGRPDQNGSHEQFHRILKARTTRPPADTLRAQQRRFDHFCHEYNQERPHQALHDAVPAARYRPSRRPYPRRLPPLDYPGHWNPRRVQPNGRITFGAHAIFLSRALAGEWVALEEHDDDLWTIYFATVPLARWLPRSRQLRPLHAGSKID
jgi:transposase InsO family protein